MTTPTTNTVPITEFDRNDTAVPWLVWNAKWGGALGTGVTLDYSFDVDPTTFKANYGDGLNEPGSMHQLAQFQRNGIVNGLAIWALVADLHFNPVTESSTQVGDIRFGISGQVQRTGHAYLPATDPEAGDVWFSPVNWTDDLHRGSFDAYVILHEIGHALGLEHTFTDPLVAPTQFDNHFYSIMAYKASPDSDPVNGGFGDFYPTTPMFYDILAMQSMYGKNLTANAGATTYTYVQGTQYFETIYDFGGNDTIQFSGTESCRINLTIGAFSRLSAPITFDVGSSQDTVCIGPSTIIENALGGAGGDQLIGNSSANVLTGNGGADTLTGDLGADRLQGSAGADHLDGGNGADILNGGAGVDVLTGGANGDIFVFSTALGAANRDTITDYKPSADTIRLDNAIFTAIGPDGDLAASRFHSGASAGDASDRIIYDPATGALYYDADGTGAGAQIQFATLSAGLTMTHAEFVVI